MDLGVSLSLLVLVAIYESVLTHCRINPGGQGSMFTTRTSNFGQQDPNCIKSITKNKQMGLYQILKASAKQRNQESTDNLQKEKKNCLLFLRDSQPFRAFSDKMQRAIARMS